MDDINFAIKKKYAKDAAMQERAADLNKELSILDDPLIRAIRENKVNFGEISALLIKFLLFY
jgi:hypothetical protein